MMFGVQSWCVGKPNGVGLSRAKFEEGAGRGLVAVPGVMEGRRRAVGDRRAGRCRCRRVGPGPRAQWGLRPRPRRTQEGQATSSAASGLSMGGPVAGMSHLSEWTAARMAVIASGWWIAAMTRILPAPAAQRPPIAAGMATAVSVRSMPTAPAASAAPTPAAWRSEPRGALESCLGRAAPRSALNVSK